MELSQKQKMLGAALCLRKLNKQSVVYIMMTLEHEDDIDDMTWYMGQHPQADDVELMAVASQLVKERKEKETK
jgi:hypothetical protein